MVNAGGDAVGAGDADLVRGCAWEDVEAALRAGWRVFPLWGLRGSAAGGGGGGWICACPAGAGCTQGPGKHPAVAGGFTQALGVADGGQAAVEAVAAWWAEGGGARNLGIRTGSVSDLIVVDVDARSGGLESVDRWGDATGLTGPAADLTDLGATRVATGRLEDAGFEAAGHWYLRWDPEWLALGRTVAGKNGVLPGIDIKADGGYVVGVGSAHISGGWYRWLSDGAAGVGGGPGAAVPGEFMAWLRDARGGAGRTGGGGGGGGGVGSGEGGGSTFREIRRSGAGVAAGGRDDYFNRLAFQLRSAGGRGVPWEYALAEVRAEWEKCAQPAGDEFTWETALGKLERVWATVPAGGFPQEKVTHNTGVGVGVGVGADTGETAISEIADTDTDTAAVLAGAVLRENPDDTGNGLRYVRLFRDQVMHVRQMGSDGWFVWDATEGFWRPDVLGRALEMTKSVAEDVVTEAAVLAANGESDAATALYKWGRGCFSMARRKSLLESASVEEGIGVSARALDADPWLMALCGGMTVDLRVFGRAGWNGAVSASGIAEGDGGVRRSEPGDRMTRQAGVSWEDVLEARSRLPGRSEGSGLGVVGTGWAGGLWEKHVLRMVRGDQEAAAWLRRCVGYSLTGSVQEQTMTLLYGEGENGKNVFMETLGAVWGDYAVKAQAGILTASDDEHPVGLYTLRGARLVFVDEVGRSRINETRLKDMVGGAIMRARDIGGGWIEFPVEAKIWVACNALPGIRDNSHGMWRRLRVSRLRGQLGKDGWKRENGYGERLLTECRGEVLAWALDGLVEWMACGLGSYADMEESVRVYRADEDLFGMFVSDCLDTSDVDLIGGSAAAARAAGVQWTDLRALYQAYMFWCAQSTGNREKTLNVVHFSRELRKAIPGVVVVRGGVGEERTQRVFGVTMRTREVRTGG